MPLRVRILPRAKADFVAMYAYIKRRSPQGARRWREALETAVNSVAKNPQQGGEAPEDALVEREIRQKLFRTSHGLTYRVVYTVHVEELIVLRVRGPGQPPLADDEIDLI